MILNDIEIMRLSRDEEMISPWASGQVREIAGQKIVSYGPTSFGYDIRVDRKFKIFTNALNAVVDPKNFDEGCFVDVEDDVCIIPPNSFVLAVAMERLKMPDDVVAVCVGKSTYARCGIIVNVTPAEPGWEGYLTLELSNTTPLPAKVYAGEGIAQLMFYRGSRPKKTYRDRNGKYMGQPAVPVVSRM